MKIQDCSPVDEKIFTVPSFLTQESIDMLVLLALTGKKCLTMLEVIISMIA